MSSNAPRLDHMDAEDMTRMLESRCFRAIWVRIEADLRRRVETCTSSDNELEIRRAQGAAAALRMVLDVPGQLLDEIKRGPARYVQPKHPISPRPSNLPV